MYEVSKGKESREEGDNVVLAALARVKDGSLSMTAMPTVITRTSKMGKICC
jgi:hypothetical protein